jgi:hypothetical protein
VGIAKRHDALTVHVEYWAGICPAIRRDIKGRPFWSRF